MNAQPLPNRFRRVLLLVTGLLVIGGLCRFTLLAGEAQLKNGTIIRGNMWLLNSLGGRPVGISELLSIKDADPVPRNIVLVSTGWQKYYVPKQQIPNDQLNHNVQLKPLAFTFEHRKTNQSQEIAFVGSVKDLQPFDEFGRRRLTLESSRGDLQVIQGITHIEPDHAVVEALNYKWRTGLALRAIPDETLHRLLRSKIKADDPAGRLGLVAFYRQAEYFPQAFAELEAIVRDFPDQQGRVEGVRTELMDQWGREVLRRLNQRKAAGQHQLAEEFGKTLSKQQLGGAVLADVQTFLAEYDQARRAIDKAKNLLADWQSKLKDERLVELVQPLRGEINEQLGFATLPRLDAFLKSETDANLTADQQLALAYSGWVVGPANAVTDLAQAIRLWDARFLMLEYTRAESVQERSRLYELLRQVEGVGPLVVMQLARLLPPQLDAGGLATGEPHRISVTPDGHDPAIAYSVLLPPEYSPHHSYPLLIALRSRGRTNDETLRWWSGDADAPREAARRGCIVIAPEYAPDTLDKYTYSITAHQVVIESLRDARRRFSVDADRVFLAGHGMGADAAFDLGMSHPDEFAGVIPIGGDCSLYPKITYENGRYTAWYVVGRGFDSNDQRDPSNNDLFDNIFKRGARFDFLLVEYLGRGNDRYLDEIPKVFDWIELHRRQPLPKEFTVESLRKTDNRFFWATALNLPRTTVLPLPPGAGSRINPMNIEARVLPGNVANNNLSLESPSDRYLVRFLPDLIDFNKRVVVKVNKQQKFNGFVTPDTESILEELRTTGDRTRLPLATMQF